MRSIFLFVILTMIWTPLVVFPADFEVGGNVEWTGQANNILSSFYPDEFDIPSFSANQEIGYLAHFEVSHPSLKIFLSDTGKIGWYENASLTNTLTESFLSFSLGDFFFDLGKKKISHTLAFLQSPMDLALQRNNNLSQDQKLRTEKSEGLWMFQTEFFAPFGTLSGFFSPELEMTNEAVQYFGHSQSLQAEVFGNTDIGGMNIGALVYYRENLNIGMNISGTWRDAFEWHAEALWKQNQDRFVWSMQEVKIFTNSLHIWSNQTESVPNTVQAVVGGSWTGSEFSVMLEYALNTAGFPFSEWKDIRENLNSLKSEYAANHTEVTNPLINPSGFSAFQSLGNAATFFFQNSPLTLAQHHILLRVASNGIKDLNWTALILFTPLDASGLVQSAVSYTSGHHLQSDVALRVNFGESDTLYRLGGQDWSLTLSGKWMW